MKIILPIFLAILWLTPGHVPAHKKPAAVKGTKDTIVFVPNFDFWGPCEHYCFAYIAGETTVETFNGLPNPKEINFSLFIECPTKYRFKKGKRYKFLVEDFKANSCTAITDSTYNTRNYRLISELK